MDYRSSDRYVSAGARSIKVVVLGPFAVGKTTLVGSVSEIRPMRTEEQMTRAGELIDDLGGMKDKTTTTVAMDFGRVALAEDIVLYLFGAPGQPRFHRIVGTLLEGALGGLVLVDTRRIEESFDAIDLLESTGLPYAVAINHFAEEGAPRYSDAEIRDSLTMSDDRPLVWLDARYRHSAKEGLIALVTDIFTRPRLEPVR